MTMFSSSVVLFSPTASSACRRLAVSAMTVAVSVLAIAAPARADPFLITAGQLTFRANGSVGVDISGPGFSLGFADTNPEDFGLPGLAIENADPFGATFPVSGHVFVDLSATLNRSGEVLAGGVLLDLLFDGPDAPAHRTDAPCDGCTRVAATAPFHVTGRLHAVGGPNQIVDEAIVGAGTAEVGFVLPPGEMPSAFAAFRFEPVAATPEPGTLLLVASGALFLRCRSRRPVSAPIG
jgi:PEP-CTERM motif-containing protein